jgi:archaellin
MLDSKGQTGISSLILFIVMLLVAAIGASTLMQTSEKLQRQAALTGGQGLKEVSTKITVKSITGFASAPSTNRFDKLILTVSLSGIEELPLSGVVMSYQAGDVYISRIYYNASATDANGYPDFNVNTVQGDADGLLEKNELLELHFWIEDGDAMPLNASTEFMLTITPRGGTSTLVRAATPAMIRNKYTLI